VTALQSGDRVLAAAFGLRRGERFHLVRVSFDPVEHASWSPGKLMLMRSLSHLASLGCRQFDLGLGDYDYKQSFNAEPLPLRDACVALTPRGKKYEWMWRLRHAARHMPRLRSFLQRLPNPSRRREPSGPAASA
jgi:CelD/BcsL family acetyltransferase involved in cellulose biosynthesis